MVINKDFSYSIKEASEVTGVHKRTLTRFASTIDANKIDGRYIFKGSQLISYLEKRNFKDLEVKTSLDIEKKCQELSNTVNLLKEENKVLEEENKVLTEQVKTEVSTSLEIKVKSEMLSSQIKALEVENKELVNKLNTYLETEKKNELLSSQVKALKTENKTFKEQIKAPLTHKEQLSKAIQLITLEAVKKGVTHKIFSEEEYDDIIGTIAQVDFQREQVEYLKNRVEKQDAVLMQLSQHLKTSNKIIEQRNFIEAKKGQKHD